MTREEKINNASYAYWVNNYANIEFIDEEEKELHTQDIQDSFINGAEWADKHPHWISVEDKLPPRWETNPNVSVPVITFGTLGESSIPFVELQRYDFGGSKWQYGDATHWMPFQFPEKGGGEK